MILFLWAVAPAPVLAEQPRIIVGPNVHVSAAFADRENEELHVSADPRDANHLIGAAIVDSIDPSSWSTVIVYESRDGGRSWRPTLEPTLQSEGVRYTMGDPATLIAPDGMAYFVAYGWDMGKELPTGGYGTWGYLYRSRDGGTTWLPPVKMDRLDTEFIAIDESEGPHRGRLYIDGASGISKTDGSYAGAVEVDHSDDSGATRPYPVKIVSAGSKIVAATGNIAVLSNGTLIVPYFEMSSEDNYAKSTIAQPDNAKYRVAVSTDGGETFENHSVSDWSAANTLLTSYVPALAVDQSGGPFRDRIYAAWNDYRSGRSRILIAHSSDAGKSWSTPYAVDDNYARVQGVGPDDFMPTLAVNNAGVVAMMWYDRRDSSDDLGWWPRFSVSLDGGDSFSNSVRLSERPYTLPPDAKIPLFGPLRGLVGSDSHQVGQIFMARESFQGGDYSGMAADAAGVFHPFWVDDRTGIQQLWTARVAVQAKAVKNGSEAFASMQDVSNGVWLEYSHREYDSRSQVITASIDIFNASKKSIKGPLLLRMLSLDSNFGFADLLDSDNGETRAGAVLNFTPELSSGELRPGTSSRPRVLRFRLSHVPSLRSAAISEAHSGAISMVDLRFQVLAK
jgi:hypothetical protein